MAGEKAKWWQTGIIYQIYPRSFQDSNNDGVGDLEGIIRRLPYLIELGVDAIWLSPIFTSPMADFGYDIADFTDVDPLFGNLADLDMLIDAAHRHQLKLILDLVPNHTSDQHPWFVESKTSRNSPKRDWFIWHAPAPDGRLRIIGFQNLGEARGNSIRTLIIIITIRFSPHTLT
jgi:alpha-glucosidase